MAIEQLQGRAALQYWWAGIFSCLQQQGGPTWLPWAVMPLQSNMLHAKAGCAADLLHGNSSCLQEQEEK